MVACHVKLKMPTDEDSSSRMECFTPTPGSEHVVLEPQSDFDKSIASTSCQIYNASGQLLKNMAITSLRTSIDVSAFPNGVYWLKVGDRT